MNFEKPQVLVTGLSGLIGSRFMQLYEEQYDLVNLDLTSGVDITNSEQVNSIFRESKARVIIHLAAFTDVSRAHEQNEDKEGSCYKVNVLGTKTIAEAASKSGKFLIHISTDYVFDGTKETPYEEVDTPHPIEWYGQTKYWAEQAVLNSQEKSVILRLAFPYQSHPKRPDFLAKIIDKLNNNSLPPAFTDHVITPTFADDVSKVFDYCIKNQPTGLYHMTGSTHSSDYDIALMIKEVFSLSGDIRPGLLKTYLKTINRPYQKTMRISNKKLTHDFGIGLMTLRDGLERVRFLINS
jgi:dTDP-4-dehydrorhamnose reductase